VEVDKYCYGGSLFSRKRKLMRLSEDQEELYFWTRHRSSKWQVTVSLKDIFGVVFGAYTCTFKKQTATNMPPHWSAFSLIGRGRTYDFSARDPDVVECCVRTLQQLVWERRGGIQALPTDKSRSWEPHQSSHSIVSMPSIKPFEPWPVGFFLWMRLRFRLQQEAQKRSLGPEYMLWTVFMRCAFLSTNEVTKARFIDMAEKLIQELGLTSSSGMQELSVKINFQKDRQMDIVKDRYVCRIENFMPRAPSGVVGGSRERSGTKEFK
jgi:hypothetical protein